MQLTVILMMPLLAVVSSTVSLVGGRGTASSPYLWASAEHSKTDPNVGALFEVRSTSFPELPASTPVFGGDGMGAINFNKRMSSADVEELDHYASKTLTGLDKLKDNILDSDFTSAQAAYNGLSPLFDQMLRCAAPSKFSCAASGTGHHITQAQAVDLIQETQQALQEMMHAALKQDQASTVEELCQARWVYFNSGLREVIFANGQVSGTGP